MLEILQIIAEKLYETNILTIIPISLFAGFLTIFASLYILDIKKKRKITKEYFISFIIPCYNSEKTLENTIRSVYNSYDKKNFELFVINDKSNDNTLRLMKYLQNEFGFIIINNLENIGKTNSINETVKKTSGEIIFTIDSDMKITKDCVNDVIARFNSNENIGAISCPCNVKGKSFFSLMQAVEYSAGRFISQAYNCYSTVALWGGCIATRRKAFDSVNGFSITAYTEDTDYAMKLNEKKWKVEQSGKSVETLVPENFKGWFKQKIRWNAGLVQSFLEHRKAYLTNPITIYLIAMYLVLFYIIMMNGLITSFYYNFFEIAFWLIKYGGFTLFHSLKFTTGIYKKEIGMVAIYQCFFLAVNIPYAALLIKEFKDIKKILLIIPFSLIYCPLFYITLGSGAYNGFKQYKNIKKGIAKRAW